MDGHDLVPPSSESTEISSNFHTTIQQLPHAAGTFLVRYTHYRLNCSMLLLMS